MSLPGAVVVSPSGQLCGLSGTLVGDWVDLQNGNTNCNVWISTDPAVNSGGPIIGVQTSPDTTSGNFTDPTSGFAASDLPSWMTSGGLYRVGASGYPSNLLSGVIAFGHFQRPHRYARLNFVGGAYVGGLAAGFVTNVRTTGSGGGFTYSPSSGTPSV